MSERDITIIIIIIELLLHIQSVTNAQQTFFITLTLIIISN